MGPGPSNNGGAGGGASASVPMPFNIPPNPNGPPAPRPSTSSSNEKKDMNFNSDFNSAFIQQEGGSAGRDTNREEVYVPPPSYESLSPDDNLAESNKPKPQPRSKIPPEMGTQQPAGSASAPPSAGFPDLPNVPLDLPDIPDDTNNEEEIDFDDLSRRFEELKRRK